MSNLISTVGDGQQTNHDQIPDLHRPPCQLPCHGDSVDSVTLLNDSGADNSSCNGLVVVVKVVEKSNKTGGFHHSDKNSKSCQTIWCFFFPWSAMPGVVSWKQKIMSRLYFLQHTYFWRHSFHFPTSISYPTSFSLKVGRFLSGQDLHAISIPFQIYFIQATTGIPLNGITLGPRKTNYIFKMITITKHNVLSDLMKWRLSIFINHINLITQSEWYH